MSYIRIKNIFSREENLMKTILLTNNPMFKEFTNLKVALIFLENLTFLEVLLVARNFIHKGHRLLTHPLSSSIKPHETPYKSLILSQEMDSLDLLSLQVIEDALETTKKFSKDSSKRIFSEKILNDFQLIDSDIIKNAMEEIWKRSTT